MPIREIYYILQIRIQGLRDFNTSMIKVNAHDILGLISQMDTKYRR